MKDDKYEVGDVIAFRVKSTAGLPKCGEYLLREEGPGKVRVIVTAATDFTGPDDTPITLERIPNPKLMEGEWWNGWMMRFIAEGETAPEGALFFVGCCGRDESKWSTIWCRGHSLVPDPPCGKDDRYALIPPQPDPKPLCPELREKIERVEAELALLKKQALGE